MSPTDLSADRQGTGPPALPTPEPEALRALRRETEALQQGWWATPPEEGRLISWLAGLTSARRCLEIGTFTGYATLWLALTLPDDGHVLTCDLTGEFAAVGQPHWRAAGVAEKIDLRIGPALETLDELIANGRAGTFDFAFIDADKKRYPAYYERCIELIRTSGIIAIDNVYWYGATADPGDQRGSTRAIRQLNARIAADHRVDAITLPVADGVTLARKLI